jgi:hypothetical protein
MMFKFVAIGLAYTAAFAAAYTAPKMTGTGPDGNAITSPGLAEEVPAGKPYTIIWDPSTPGPVTLVFLKGPSANAVPQYAIAEHIANTGSYEWTPSTSLAPGTTGYGILLVDDVTGAYQYSTQFGIKNSAYGSGSSIDASTQASAGATTSSAVTKTSVASYGVTSTATLPLSYTTTSSASATDDDDETTTSDDSATTTTCLTTPSLAATSAVVTTKASASGNSTAPTLRTTTTSSASSTQSTGPAAATGAAVHTVASSFAGLVFAAGVAVLAL